MGTKTEIKNSITDDLKDIQFTDIFNLSDIQRIQDLFANATGVASIITNPDGVPITNPTNFCRLCSIIRKTEKGHANCTRSYAVLGRNNPLGPIVQPCLSVGLCSAGTSITVGGKHIANWIISQVRSEEVDEQQMIQYANVIGANREEFKKAINEVPVMSVEQFNNVSKMLFAFANELTDKAYNNLQLKLQITESENAIRLLQESEERFQMLFDKAPLGHQSLDFDGFFIDVNQQWLETLGYAREEVIGKWFGDFLSPAYQDGFRKRFPVFKDQGHIHSEFEIIHKNGSILFIAFDGKIGYQPNGEFKQTHCILKDITGQRKAEEALIESEIKYRGLVENSPDVIAIHSEGKIVFVNKECLRLMAVASPEELIGKPVIQFVHPDYRAIVIERVKKATNEGATLPPVEEKFVRPDGSVVEVEVKSMSIRFENKPAVQLIIRDITDRKLAEQELIKAKERAEEGELKLRNINEELIEKNTFIQAILDNLPIGLALNNITEGQAMYMNKKFEEIYGWTSKEITSISTFFEKIYPDEVYRKEIVERIMADILSGDPGKMHWENIFITRKDGSRRIVNAVNIPLIQQNTMVSTVVDITTLHNIQIDLEKAKEQAEESDNLKTAFLNNISHEIRTPFNGILGFLSLLQDSEVTEGERDEYISIINKSAYRLMNTINDIVEISQIQAGQTKLMVTETNIRKLASGVYSHFKSDAESNGLKFFIQNDLPNNLECIYTDSIKLNAILSVLIGNAIKFTKTGSIQFGIRLVDKNGEFGGDKASGRDNVCFVSTPSKIQFSVKDTGVGISKSKQNAIFERFTQADGSNTRQFEGSGLGLAIAKAYVEMLGGKIGVESDPEANMGEKGSTFYFTIPFNIKPEEKNHLKNIILAEEAENQINPEVSGLKILIAEDDEESAMLLAIAIKSYSKEVIKVRTGVEAIEACRNNPDIDMILMDIKMPDMNGHEATRQIRQFNRDVIIIAQTAYALIGDREQSIAVGCNDYISKPIKKEQLMVLVEKYFKK